MLIGPKKIDKGIFNYQRAWRDKRSGFSLVEILITAFLLSIVLTGLFLTLDMGEFANSVSIEKLQTQEQVRRIMNWIVKDVRQTSSSQISNNEPSDSHVKFKVCLGHDGSNILWSSGYIEYTYDSSLNRLIRTDSGSGDSWVFDNIIAAPFDTSELISDNKLTVTITSRRQRLGLPDITVTLTNKIKLRNG